MLPFRSQVLQLRICLDEFAHTQLSRPVKNGRDITVPPPYEDLPRWLIVNEIQLDCQCSASTQICLKAKLAFEVISHAHATMVCFAWHHALRARCMRTHAFLVCCEYRYECTDLTVIPPVNLDAIAYLNQVHLPGHIWHDARCTTCDSYSAASYNACGQARIRLGTCQACN